MRWTKDSMLRKILLYVYVLIVGCQGQTRVDNTIKVDSIKYPLLVDNGRRIIHYKGGDTVTLTNGQLYQNDSSRHPLLHFYLSYHEWETISCIIALDEQEYWGKTMIGLIERTGNLRTSYKGQKLRLAPTMPVKIKKGEWTGTFKSDCLEIQISGQLANRGSSRSLWGQGNLVFTTPDQIIEETIFLVYEKE
jgi:hypothetical protein